MLVNRCRSFLSSALLLCAFSIFSCGTSLAANTGPEDFKIEVTGAAWTVNASGQLLIDGTSFDLVHQLAVGQNHPTFYGKLVIKPGRRHRIVVEGTPFRLSGYNVVDQTFFFRGRQYPVNATLQSSADLNYLFAGYQYDVISRPMGHLGFSVGGAYLGATGTVNATDRSLTSFLLGTVSTPVSTTLTKKETVGVPLAGVEFRIFPIPHHPILEVNGEARGMGFGSYGHYVEGAGNAGINLGHFAIEAGYRTVVADIHSTSQTPSGIFAHLHGPIYSVVFRY